MIALRIVPVELADEAAAARRRDGAGVLVPAAGSTAWMEHGEEGEGWYTVNAAVVYMMCYGGFHRHAEGRRYVRCVVADDSEIVAEVGYIGGQLVALMVSHFSSPVDEADVFEDTPLLTLPNVREVPKALVQDVAAMLKPYNPNTHEWSVGDYFMIEHPVPADREFVEKFGLGPHEVIAFGNASNLLATRWGFAKRWFTPSEVRPCLAPEETKAA